MERTDQQQPGKFANWLKTSLTARMFMVGSLTLILLIPLFYIESLINERARRQQSVIYEINQQWGNEVLLYGPILKVPYKTYSTKTVTDKKTKKVYTETTETVLSAYFFPEDLDISSTINPEVKKRGIYTTTVYNSDLAISGTFIKPNFQDAEINPEDILWDKTKVIIKTSNVKGVSEAQLQLSNLNYPLVSQYPGSSANIGGPRTVHVLETKAVDSSLMQFEKPLAFDLSLAINGSTQIQFVPVGKTTEARIASNWKTANFFGEFLPYNDDKITPDGFDAKWKVLDLNRPFPQSHFNGLPNLSEFAFGVNFMIPVDEYQKSERSAKYGFLVIGLTLLIFFLIQTLSKINIHPFQYLMIGLALTMFYTLLISISEHSNFLTAYLIAGSSVIILITWYSRSILKNLKFPAFIGLALTAVYAFIFVIIQLENYALIVGSIGLFLILASVMFVSRKIDWSNS